MKSFQHLFKEYLHGRSARFQCAAICSANVNCVAYYYESSECHESDGIGLIGSSANSQGTRIVYIDHSLEPGSCNLYHTLSTNSCCILVDCSWKSWNTWQSCSKTCGGGTQKRTMSVNPVKFGGTNCTGTNNEDRECATQSCPGMITSQKGN